MAVMLCAIIYTFKGLIKPVIRQLEQTSILAIILICISCVCYECLEGWVTCSFARKYKKDFKYRHGVESAFYACFYRVATLGSGSGLSLIYFLHEQGIEYSTGTGMYMIEYLLHKISITLFSIVFLIVNFAFIQKEFSGYMPLLISGYILTAAISLFLLLFCISKKIHRFFLIILEKINKKLNERLKKQVIEATKYAQIIEEATRDLLHDKRLILTSIAKNFVKLLFWYGIPYIIFYKTHLLTLGQAIAITSLCIMLAAVIPSPAGIGAVEFVMIILFSKIAGRNLAVCTSILYRFATFILPFLLGAGYVIVRKMILHHKKAKKQTIE